MYDQMLSLLLVKRRQPRRGDRFAEQAFYEAAGRDVPVFVVKLWHWLARR